MANTALTPVEFHGATLVTTIINGAPYVAIRPIAEALNLDWAAQFSRIKRHPVLSSTVVITATVAEDGKQREMFMLPLDKLNGWLFGVSVGRVKPELRARLTQYQAECFDVLAQHFGAPKIELSGNPGQLPNALRQISAPELPGIDVRALLTTGQSDPVAMTPDQLALIEEKTWQLLGEARGLIHTHILRAVAFRSTSIDRTDPQCRHIASVINEITLNKALAQSYWTELRHLQVCAQLALGVAQDNIKRLDDALAGKDLVPRA